MERVRSKPERANGDGPGLLILAILTGITGVVGCIGYLRSDATTRPRIMAFGWFAVFASGLVYGIVRRWCRKRRHETMATRR